MIMKLINLIRKVSLLLLMLFFSFGYSQVSYQPNDALRNSIRKQVWQELKLKTPKKQRFMASLVFNSNECFKLYDKAAQQRNWKPYELHTVTAFYQVILEEAIAGRNYSEEEIKKVYESNKTKYQNKAIGAISSSNALQENYDPLIVKALWIATLGDLTKQNSNEVKELAKSLLEVVPDIINKNSSEIASKEKPIIIETKSKTQKDEPQLSNVSNNVEDIIMRTVTLYGLNGVYIKNEISVLYSNGEVYTNPTAPLNNFNISKSKIEKPKRWRTWKRNGAILKVYDPRKQKTYEWKKWFKVRSASVGFKLSGKYNTSDAFGGSAVINASTVVFDKQGRFAWKTIKGGNTAWKPIFSKNNSAGTYHLNDYKITLKYNNGVVESFFFGLYPKDDEHFVIGANHFVPAEK